MTNPEDTNIKQSILIADDNQDNLKVLGSMLEQNGYDVRVATNGEQVLASAEELAPDLFLLDIHMPKLDGYETCEKLKCNKTLAKIPVIFISALTEKFNKLKGFEMGAVDYIVKPFELEEVKVRIETHLRLCQQIKELEILNESMINREMRIVELKQEVNSLAKQLGQEAPYPEDWSNISG